MATKGGYLIEPNLWRLCWVCTFCHTSHLWEGGLPNDHAVREARFQVAQATADHLHCRPGCGRWISRGAVTWQWDHDE